MILARRAPRCGRREKQASQQDYRSAAYPLHGPSISPSLDFHAPTLTVPCDLPLAETPHQSALMVRFSKY